MSADPATGDGSDLSEAAGAQVSAEPSNKARAEESAAADAEESAAGGAGPGATAEGAGSWAPDACTLPTADRPLRAADFDAVFAATVRGLHRIGPTRLRLDLEPGPQAAARMAELAAAEAGCCSFFTFALTATGGALTLDITVPQEYAAVLATLAHRAGAAAGLAS